MTRISFFVHDLSSNPIVRAAALARALSGAFDVEMLGFVHSDEGVYAPYRDLFTYRTIRTSRDATDIAAHSKRLADMATGDVIYACKPLATSFGPALLASGFGRSRRLLLDAEDDEWVPMGRTWTEFVRRDVVRGWRHASAWKYTMALHPFVMLAAAVTVSSRRLQRRYGGTIVRHGPDEHVFNPASAPSSAEARSAFGLPDDVPLALFAGMPQPHKGFDVLRSALLAPRASQWHLALAGPPDHPEFQACRSTLGARCHYVGLVPQSRMPALLAAVDAAPVPQLRVTFAESQLPAKALEAMAMARAVIASRVADLPEMLGENARGWLVPPGDAAALADALAHVAASPDERRMRGARAREWFLNEGSAKAARDRLVPLVRSALDRAG